MAAGFKPGDKAYIVENNRIVRQCTVVRGSGNLFIIKFDNGGGIQVKGHRLFATQEEAENSVPKLKKTKSSTLLIGHHLIIGIKKHKELEKTDKGIH